jgi:hypothetical protein
MPTYSYKRPVKVLLDDSSKYEYEHMSHFFNIECRKTFYSMTQEEKELVYDLFTEHEDVLVKVFGDGITKSTVLWSKMMKDGVDNDEIKAYKEWLDKK